MCRLRPGALASAQARAQRHLSGGAAFDFCVRYSAEDAVREGFVVVVVEDACRGIDVQGSVAAARSSLAALKASRITAGELSAFLDMGD